ncbi:hypothetical protein DPEC_G00073000 [Dallia pectoralis]|uniref:Uncharacterized protein n=1 Tax=Dallia pectoralis TaxID=75939 RepID=A0ACC2H380_DALPE|nr:hypothetical protein DPEC_G00073000 [Dallia pectoralis]
MGADTEEHLCAILRDSPVSFQMDETTTSDNNALLIAYICFKASSSERAVEAQATFRTSGWGSCVPNMRSLALWEKTRLLIAFPTTCLVEQGSSHVLQIQSKYRNCLDLMASGTLQLKLTSLQFAEKKLAEKHQTQGSY